MLTVVVAIVCFNFGLVVLGSKSVFCRLDKFGYYPKDVDSNNAAELVHDLVTW